MKIVLARHGSLEGDDERSGYLSAVGRQRVRAVARALKREGIEPTAVLTSPLPACVQSAELFAEGLDFLGVVRVAPSLGPGAPAAPAAAHILGSGDVVLVIAQEPALASLGALLASRPSFPLSREAQASLLDGGAPAWLLRPDTLEKAPLLLA